MILTELRSAIQDSVRDFAQSRIKPRSAMFDERKGYPPATSNGCLSCALFSILQKISPP